MTRPRTTPRALARAALACVVAVAIVLAGRLTVPSGRAGAALERLIVVRTAQAARPVAPSARAHEARVGVGAREASRDGDGVDRSARAKHGPALLRGGERLVPRSSIERRDAPALAAPALAPRLASAPLRHARSHASRAVPPRHERTPRASRAAQGVSPRGPPVARA